MPNIRSLNVPEGTPIATIETAGICRVTKPWLSLFREMSLLLRSQVLTPVVSALAAFDATMWTASAGAWTLVEADVVTFGWLRVGRQMTVVFEFATTTVSATPLELRVVIPNRETAKYLIRTLCVLSDNGTAAAGVVSVAASGTTLVFTRLDGAAFAAAADTTAVRGTFTFEVT
jgi:hypothetical protein